MCIGMRAFRLLQSFQTPSGQLQTVVMLACHAKSCWKHAWRHLACTKAACKVLAVGCTLSTTLFPPSFRPLPTPSINTHPCHARTQVTKTGDVIEFYNAVFIPAVKAFVLALGAGKARLVPLPALAQPGTPLRLAGGLGSQAAAAQAALQRRAFSTPPAPDRSAACSGTSDFGTILGSSLL